MPGIASRKLIVVAVVVIVVIIAVAIFASMALAPHPTVKISSYQIELTYTGTTTEGYFGPATQTADGTTVRGGAQFPILLNFTNRGNVTHQINAITVSSVSFSVASMNASTPVAVSPGQNVSVLLTVQAPNTNFNGILVILVTSS
jgi:hypothetical protein